jgi:hypothetical protein
MTVHKKSEFNNNMVVRLYEPTGKKQIVDMVFPSLGISEKCTLNGFEIQTVGIDIKRKECRQIDLMESEPRKSF